jgi:redox-sensitive bicupin YhaK (pirin superfamily)
LQAPGTQNKTRYGRLVIIAGQKRNIDGFDVLRVLPSMARRLVGPFIFFDHIGPAELAPGQGLDVRPHPHINLATVTYLFDGELAHRDNIGCHEVIRPGAINWMTAGRGIAHSERTPVALRESGSRLHGLQVWVALPKDREEVEPDFRHHAADTLPSVEVDGVRVRVLAGGAFGVTSPVRTLSPLFYVEAILPAGARLPVPQEHEERAVYVVEGNVACGSERAPRGHMIVLGGDATVIADEPSRVMLLGGAALEGPRHIWWNFVSSSKERIEQAKRDWREGRFAKIPGDETEFIPLPDGS